MVFYLRVLLPCLAVMAAGVAANECPPNHHLIGLMCYRRTESASQAEAIAGCTGAGEVLVDGQDVEELTNAIKAFDTPDTFRGEFAWTTATRKFGFPDNDEELEVPINRNKGTGCVAMVITKEGNGEYRAKSCDSSFTAICKVAPTISTTTTTTPTTTTPSCVYNAGPITYESPQDLETGARAGANIVLKLKGSGEDDLVCQWEYGGLGNGYFIGSGCEESEYSLELSTEPSNIKLSLPALNNNEFFLILNWDTPLPITINSQVSLVPTTSVFSGFCILPDGSTVFNENNMELAELAAQCLQQMNALDVCPTTSTTTAPPCTNNAGPIIYENPQNLEVGVQQGGNIIALSQGASADDLICGWVYSLNGSSFQGSGCVESEYNLEFSIEPPEITMRLPALLNSQFYLVLNWDSPMSITINNQTSEVPTLTSGFGAFCILPDGSTVFNEHGLDTGGLALICNQHKNALNLCINN